jgi:hypothetical protein
MNKVHANLSIALNSSPPYSWAQLMRLLVDVYVVLAVLVVRRMYCDEDVCVWARHHTSLVCAILIFVSLVGLVACGLCGQLAMV